MNNMNFLSEKWKNAAVIRKRYEKDFNIKSCKEATNGYVQLESKKRLLYKNAMA